MTNLEDGAPNLIDAVTFARALGRLEGSTEALESGQGELRRALDDGLREVNRRIDRLFYAMLGIGGALIVAVLASNYLGE